MPCTVGKPAKIDYDWTEMYCSFSTRGRARRETERHSGGYAENDRHNGEPKFWSVR